MNKTLGVFNTKNMNVFKNQKTVIIQKQLLHELKININTYNQINKNKLKLDIAIYFLSLFNSIPSYYREDKNDNDFINLNSKILKKASSRYKQYFDFFLNKDYILKGANYSTDKGESNSFKLNEDYSKDEITLYHLSDKILLKAFIKVEDLMKVNENNIFCKNKRPHLTKYFNQDLRINYDEAFSELKMLLPLKYRKFTNGCQIVNEFINQYWRYSIKPETDNRVHSNLTRSPKIIRKYLTYKGEQIEGVDVKTSQPFFLAVILEAILKKDKSLFNKIKANKIFPNEVIDELFNLKLNQKEISDFIDSVTKKDFYNEFSKKLTFKYDEEGKVYRMVSNFTTKDKVRKRRRKNNNSHSKVTYKDERDATKKIVMELFYSSPNSRVKEASIFRKQFPCIHKVFDCIYKNNVPLHHLLQYVEAYILLDYVALKISKQYPEMPLWSIHDCLVTTSSNIYLLQERMIQSIKEITTFTPQLEIETWKDKEDILEAS